VGNFVGFGVGNAVGFAVGLLVGPKVGAIVGLAVGDSVGEGVGFVLTTYSIESSEFGLRWLSSTMVGALVVVTLVGASVGFFVG
jgi:hypothetical protein